MIQFLKKKVKKFIVKKFLPKENEKNNQQNLIFPLSFSFVICVSTEGRRDEGARAERRYEK